MTYWSSSYEGAQSSYRARVIAVGEDFVLFEPAGGEVWTEEEEDQSAASSFAEFSGLFVRFCDETMPSAEDRAALAAMWPLKPGDTAAVAGERPGKVTVKEETEFFFMGENRKAWTVDVEYDGAIEVSTVLPDYPMIANFIWAEAEGEDRLMAVNSNAAGPTPEDLEAKELGTCASLIE
ncbi:hypothetical protein WNY37_14865 [Henriciella sp. AS95]|uniref:hypothetical protein n=1 Tax=Henriciella sp. AS95 TaxID=3135782 RepID=UPI00318186FA